MGTIADPSGQTCDVTYRAAPNISGCLGERSGRHSWRYGGRSEHPHPDCSRPFLLRCGACPTVVVKRCGRSSSQCASCAATYRRRVRRVASSGVLLPGLVYLLTLTAPGNAEHAYRGQRCPCTAGTGLSDEVDLARWNGQMVHRWNRLHQALQRRLGVRIDYFRAVETQRRGALHLHVLVRVSVPVRIRESMLRAEAMRHGYGHSVDVAKVDGERAAGYVAKYVTKAADERGLVPYVHRVTGEFGPGRWRAWVASRRWGESMATVRGAQRAWAQARRAEAATFGASQAGGARRGADDGADAAGALDPNRVRYTTGTGGRLLSDAGEGSVLV